MGATQYDTPYKEESRTNNPSLSTLWRVLGFSTNKGAARQSALLAYTVMNSTSAGASTLPFSVMSAIIQTSGIKEKCTVRFFNELEVGYVCF